MFKFLRPKRNVIELGEWLANIMPTLLIDSKSAATEKSIADMVLAGAAPDRIRPEFSAFNCFVVWLGMAACLQKRKITEEQFERLCEAFFGRLQELARDINVVDSGSHSYSSFAEWLQARIDRYILISTTYGPEDVGRYIVDGFCDFACDGLPTTELRRIIQSNYILGSGSAYDMISGYRLV